MKITNKPKVVVFAPHGEPKETIKSLEEVGCEISTGKPSWQLPGNSGSSKELMEMTRGADALMGFSQRNTPITRAVMETSDRLRVVAKYTVGVDDIDVDSATELGILVCHSPIEVNFFAVAEMTMALMLALLKKLRERDTLIRAGGWRPTDFNATYVGSRQSDGYAGITVGLVGLGRIAMRVAQLLAPWHVRIIAYDPYVEDDRFLLAGARRVDYHTLLREADVVSFHVVLTKETQNMFSDAELALMKPSAVLINTARGKIVDEDALARALTAGTISAAAIDAFAVEPLPLDSPLRQVGDKVLLTGHAAAQNHGAGLRAGIEWSARSLIAALSGAVPDNVYNKEVIPRWKERFGNRRIIAR